MRYWEQFDIQTGMQVPSAAAVSVDVAYSRRDSHVFTQNICDGNALRVIQSAQM